MTAKLTVTVGDKLVFAGMVNSFRVDSDTASLKMNGDAVIEIDADAVEVKPPTESA